VNYLIDTCVVSEFAKPKPSTRVLTWFGDVPESRVYLSVITLGEIRKGILSLSDAAKARRLQAWLDNDLRSRFHGRLLGVDVDVAMEWGAICAEAERAGAPRPVIDALLAATARVNGLTLVTRNTADFAHIRVDVFNPWTDG
jgi:predicted nucleic acid-binding protein